jgi:dTDP-4-dehydrorhamnose 3,5-epimerase
MAGIVQGQADAAEKMTVRMGKIDGVVLHPLARHPDDRGYFEELIRVDPFNRASASSATRRCIRRRQGMAHPQDADRLRYVAVGLLVALHDKRPDSPTAAS